MAESLSLFFLVMTPALIVFGITGAKSHTIADIARIAREAIDREPENLDKEEEVK